jgi:hypothetical protein
VLLKTSFENPFVRPKGMNNKAYKKFMRFSRKYFLDKKSGRLYRRGKESKHLLVVDKEHRTYMMRAAHNSLGHRGNIRQKRQSNFAFGGRSDFSIRRDWIEAGNSLDSHAEVASATVRWTRSLLTATCAA